MNPILDRVYRVDDVARPGAEEARMARDAIRIKTQEGAKALSDALTDLRHLRERSQGVVAVREEIDFLRDQIVTLRLLSAQITLLRLELSRPPPSPPKGRGRRRGGPKMD